jgi:molybdate transport system substrate-binding protein
LSAGAAKALVEGLAAEFHRDTGAVIRGTFGAVGAMRERLLAGDACDAFVSTAAMLDSLEQDGRVIAGTVRTLGRVRTGIAVRAGEPLGDVSTGDALAARLRDAPAIYVPDTERATAGIHFVRVLDRLGLLATLAAKLRTYPNGAVAMQRLARDGPAGTDGVVLAGLLPNEYELATAYAAGVCTSAADASLASTFTDWIAGERATALRRAGGFEA